MSDLEYLNQTTLIYLRRSISVKENVSVFKLFRVRAVLQVLLERIAAFDG